jgi:hypothetical protein
LALGVLRQAMSHQGAKGCAVQVDLAVLPCPGLGGTESEAATDVHDLLPHGEDTDVEVDGRPPQAACLTAPEPGQRHQLVHHAEAVTRRGIEEPPSSDASQGCTRGRLPSGSSMWTAGLALMSRLAIGG